MLSAEVNIGVLHDSGIYRYDGQNQPIAFAAPSEGVLSLEQVLEHHARHQDARARQRVHQLHPRPGRAEDACARRCWYSPSNKKVKLGANYDAKLYNTEAKVAQLIQVDWKWYNERKDDIDARVTRILRG